jgi:hypothetical protein
MSSNIPHHSHQGRRSRCHGQRPPKILVDPSPETQAIYNQNREHEAQHYKQRCLQQHVISQDHLRPPNPRAPPMARSVTNESHISGSSLSPASLPDIPDHVTVPVTDASSSTGRRPRGRRAGPLGAEKRFKTAIKRKLGLVCEVCKKKKVVVCSSPPDSLIV